VRYLHIHEDEQLDEEQFAGWAKQAGPTARRTNVSDYAVATLAYKLTPFALAGRSPNTAASAKPAARLVAMASWN
jgi:hypothetical protein